MSLGSNGHEGPIVNEKDDARASAPLPADVARRASDTPTPADAARASRVKGRRKSKRADGVPEQRGASGQAPKRVKGGGGAETAQADVSLLHFDERRIRRRKTGVVAAVLVVFACVSLLVSTGSAVIYSPAEVLSCYGMWLQNLFAQVSGSVPSFSTEELLEHNKSFFLIINRVPVTLITLLCGAILAVAGSLYQSAFRNPIASPSMLGVSSAIQFGDVLLVVFMSTSAMAATGQRYALCYACIIVVMVILFICARLMTGRGRPVNIVNLLLIATVLNQIIGVLVTYVTIQRFTFEEWEVFNMLSEGMTVSTSAESWIMLIVTCLVALTPVALLRFRLNSLNFDDADMRLMGVNPSRMRVLAIVCGTIMLMGAQVEMGTIAMLAVVVPHVSRMIFGAEFRKQFWGNALLGAALLVFCSDIVSFIPVVGPLIPVSLVVNFVVLPFFVWMLATQQRGWEV